MVPFVRPIYDLSKYRPIALLESESSGEYQDIYSPSSFRAMKNAALAGAGAADARRAEQRGGARGWFERTSLHPTVRLSLGVLQH